MFNFANKLTLKIMLQRIQTVYLILSTIALTLTIWMPFASFDKSGSISTFTIFGLSTTTEDINSWFPYYVVIGLSVALSLFAITQFKNRKRQLNLGKINYLLLLATIVMLFLDTDNVAQKLFVEKIQYGFGMYLPVVALAFTFLANRSIKKDEDLVKSVERLR
jgi:hypothetical protein